MKPLNPEWDLQWMDAMASGQLDGLCAMSEASIGAMAGNSAHESKTWLVARSALPANTRLPARYGPTAPFHRSLRAMA
jgi:2,3-dihydroxyphenylpropionate 1,2-dioxygenase